MTRAHLFAAVGLWRDALDAIATNLEASPALPAALKLRAEVLSYAGQYAAALAAYDAYLTVAPDDMAARRQQARVEGWRHTYGAARTRYREIVRLFPDERAVRAEARAKSAYYAGDWRQAITAYREWVALEPFDTEGRFELAQAYAQAEQYAQASRVYTTLLSEGQPHRQALDAYATMRERRATRTSFSAETQSADGYGAQRLLSRANSLAHLSGSVGGGAWSIAAGPSRVADATRTATGTFLNARVEAVAGSSWRMQAAVTAHHYANLGATFAGGDLSLSWLPTDRLRVKGGVERAALLDNLHTVAQDLAWVGPRAALSYRATSALSLDLSAAEGWVTDRNRRADAHLTVTDRLIDGRQHEVRALADLEYLQYRDARSDYFSPASFWKQQVGVVYRRWFTPLKYAGDREHWVEASYLAGVDNRRVVYQTGSVGIAHDFRSGFSLVGSGTMTRSAVYTSSGLMLTFRLRPFSAGE
jgi:tetratricopeptide (TPR) repeat protein